MHRPLVFQKYKDFNRQRGWDTTLGQLRPDIPSDMLDAEKMQTHVKRHH